MYCRLIDRGESACWWLWGSPLPVIPLGHHQTCPWLWPTKDRNRFICTSFQETSLATLKSSISLHCGQASNWCDHKMILQSRFTTRKSTYKVWIFSKLLVQLLVFEGRHLALALYDFLESLGDLGLSFSGCTTQSCGQDGDVYLPCGWIHCCLLQSLSVQPVSNKTHYKKHVMHKFLATICIKQASL